MNFQVTLSRITISQLNRIYFLMRQHEYKEYELFNELNNKAGMKLKGKGLENLTKQEASDVIEYLMEK